MTIVRYTNTLPYSYDANHPRSHYLINGQKAYKNRGELCESIAKHHRGIYTDINPNTSWDTGSDIENEFASVKSSEGGLGRNIPGNTAMEKIENYFLHTHSKTFIWVDLDEKTQQVVEYQMTKVEFRQFVENFTRIHNMSNHKELCIRFRPTSKKMIQWFESLAI